MSLTTPPSAGRADSDLDVAAAIFAWFGIPALVWGAVALWWWWPQIVRFFHG